MSESSVLTLDIGGGSSEAVSAIESVSQAFDTLSTSATNAGAQSQQAAGNVTNAGAASSEAGGQAESASTGFAGFGGALSTVGGAALGMSSELRPAGEALTSLGESAAAAGEAGAAGIAAFAAPAAAAIGAITALGEVGAEWANETMRLTAVTGLDQEQVETWSHAMSIAGGDASSLSRSVLMVQRDMESAAGGNAKYAEAFQQLGISITDADGTAKAAGEVFEELMAKLGNTDPMTRQAAVVELFGARFGGQLLPLLEHYNQIMPQAQSLTDQFGGSMGDAAAKALAYNAASEKLHTESQALGTQVLPVLTGALTAVGGVIQFVSSNFDAIVGIFGQAIPGFDLVAEGLAHIGSVAGFVGDVVGNMKGAVDFATSGFHEGAAAAEAQTAALNEDSHAADANTSSTENTAAATSHLTETLHQAEGAYGDFIKIFVGSSDDYAKVNADIEASVAAIHDLSDSTAAFYQGQNNLTIAAGSFSVPTYDVGTPYVPRTGMALIHQGEAIIPASQNPFGDGSTAAQSGGSGGDLHITVNINGPTYGMADLMSQVDEHLRDSLQFGGAFRSLLRR